MGELEGRVPGAARGGGVIGIGSYRGHSDGGTPDTGELCRRNRHGGLVGGVYATGRSASEVRRLFTHRLGRGVEGQTPYSDLTFRRKEDARDYPSTLEFGLHKGLHLPEGFNSGQQVSLILDRIALPFRAFKFQ